MKQKILAVVVIVLAVAALFLYQSRKKVPQQASVVSQRFDLPEGFPDELISGNDLTLAAAERFASADSAARPYLATFYTKEDIAAAYANYLSYLNRLEFSIISRYADENKAEIRAFKDSREVLYKISKKQDYNEVSLTIVVNK